MTKTNKDKARERLTKLRAGFGMTHRQADRQMDRQTDGQTDRRTYGSKTCFRELLCAVKKAFK